VLARRWRHSVPDLDGLCTRLFDLLVADDLDAVETMLADGVAITQNGNSMSWAEARPMPAGITDVVRNHRYEDVRRVIGTDDVVEEHTVVAESPSPRAAVRCDSRPAWPYASTATDWSPGSTSTSMYRT